MLIKEVGHLHDQSRKKYSQVRNLWKYLKRVIIRREQIKERKVARQIEQGHAEQGLIR